MPCWKNPNVVFEKWFFIQNFKGGGGSDRFSVLTSSNV